MQVVIVGRDTYLSSFIAKRFFIRDNGHMRGITIFIMKTAVRQIRFSTSDRFGNRADYIKNSKTGLLWIDDKALDYPLNTPILNGFAQAEFYLAGDPVTDLARIDMGNSTLSLERVLYSTNYYNDTIEIKERTTVSEWAFSDMHFEKITAPNAKAYGVGNPLSALYGATVDIDVGSIDANYYAKAEDGTYHVRYEFVPHMKYTAPVAGNDEAISYFAFNGSAPSGVVMGTAFDSGDDVYFGVHDFKGERKNTEAVFDENGNDITQNVPLYTMQSSSRERYIWFYLPMGDYNTKFDEEYFDAPALNLKDEDNKARIALHIGPTPENLTTCVYYPYFYETYFMPYAIDESMQSDGKHLKETKLYYKFSYPDRGEESPLYVLKLREDDVPPEINIWVSETARPTNEVQVKIESLTDTQTAPDGTVVTDTTDFEVMFAAYTEPSEEDYNSEDYDPDDYRLEPDENGIYHFTKNGYIQIGARDAADNAANILINGEPIENGSDGFTVYYVNNVRSTPPWFTNAPEVTENKENGSFRISTDVGETTKGAYIRFDKAYEKALSGSEEEALYTLSNVPGLFSGALDTENGKLSAEIYVKDGAIPLSEVAVVIENEAGERTEYTHVFTSPLSGKTPEITNAKDADKGVPILTHDEPLTFSIPVKMENSDSAFSKEHKNLPLYGDGMTDIAYIDLFGEIHTETVCANIFGAAFELKKDEIGYYTELDRNGTGRFVLTDRAGKRHCGAC